MLSRNTIELRKNRSDLPTNRDHQVGFEDRPEGHKKSLLVNIRRQAQRPRQRLSQRTPKRRHDGHLSGRPADAQRRVERPVQRTSERQGRGTSTAAVKEDP